MVAVLVLVAILVVATVGAAVLSRRQAVEQARVEREREAIARELSGHLQEAEKRESRFRHVTGGAERHGQLPSRR